MGGVPRPCPADRARSLAQAGLGAFLLAAGVAHVTALREEFRAQVPSWFAVHADLVVVASGLVEVVVGAALLVTLVAGRGPQARVAVGLATAALLVAVFPGNVAQYVEGTDAFGLDTDGARLGRLFLQPLLIAWALWCTGAAGWLADRWRRRGRRRDRA